MNRRRRLLTLPLLVTAALASGACGDDTLEPRAIDFDELQAAINEDKAAFLLNSVASRFLTDAVANLEEFGVSFEPAPSSPLALAPKVVLPPALMGRTFVWDDGSQEWVVDEERPAPAGVVRVTWYDVDGLRRPLVTEEIGYFDLTDEDAAGMSRLGVAVVSRESGTEVVVADYVVGYASTSSGSQWSLDFVADGYFTDVAGDRLDFEVTGETAGDDATNAETTDLVLTYHSSRVSYSLDLEDVVNAAGTDGHNTVSLQVVHAGATTSLQLAQTGPPAGAQGEGILRHQNAVVAEITASSGALTYRKPGGEEFSAGDRIRVQTAVVTMLESAYYLLSSLPLLELEV